MKTLLRAPCGKPDFAPWNRRRSEGFSLIELLVVIVILAIMGALLMPALSKAKHQATAAACLGNQKQLAAAFHMYSQDNSDRIVQMADYTTGEVFYSAGGFWGGPSTGPGWASVAEAIAAAQEGLRSSNALYYYCNNVWTYHCPGDTRMTRNPTSDSPNGWAYDSYARTQNLGGEPYDNFWGAGATYTKMSAIFQPGLTFSFVEEADWRGYNLGTWVLNWMGRRGFMWQDPPAIWHINVCSIGFADGRAELHKWVDSAIVVAGRNAADGHANSDWTGPGEGPDYQYVYDGYQFPGHP